MNRGAWQAKVHGITKSGTTERVAHTNEGKTAVRMMSGGLKCGFMLLKPYWQLHAILLHTWLSTSFFFTLVMVLLHGAHPLISGPVSEPTP